ncbi:MAG: M15 family metallopeptidase [Acidimicrobiales bacterium]|nr:M15 family metallopeptidase [Acidimicrobiales bacterium]
MHPYDQPHRPSAQVYRLRRAVAASALVVVAGVGWQAVGSDGGEEAAPTTTTSSTTTTLPALPACAEGEEITSRDPDQDWATILVDTARALPATYGPPDLHNISQAGFPFTEGQALRGLVMDDLAAMRQAAEANGTPIGVLASYRSYPTQVDLFTRRVDQLGASEAGSRVARPGHSEHQLGTTIDVAEQGALDVDQSFGASPTGQWIASNAHEYGFILSYPAESSATTCYDFEPWHLRYVGRDHAAAVIDSGVTLRQYLWDLEQRGTTTPPVPSTAPPQ